MVISDGSCLFCRAGVRPWLALQMICHRAVADPMMSVFNARSHSLALTPTSTLSSIITPLGQCSLIHSSFISSLLIHSLLPCPNSYWVRKSLWLRVTTSCSLVVMVTVFHAGALHYWQYIIIHNMQIVDYVTTNCPSVQSWSSALEQLPSIA